MAEKLGGMGWLLIGLAGYAILNKKTAGAAVPLTSQQIATAKILPSSVNAAAGSNGYVAWVQQSLNSLIGSGLAVDGIMGPSTRAAVMQFQGIWGLPQDGIVGPETDYDLRAALGLPGYLEIPYSQAQITTGEY